MKRTILNCAVILLTAGLANICLINAQTTSARDRRPKLSVELTADKTVYRRKDDITFKVMLINDDLTADVFIYGELGFGYRASLSLFRQNAKGQEVPTRFIDDSAGNPPDLNDPNTFVKLIPGQFLGTSYESSIYNLNLEAPGTYKIWVEYHSPIAKAGVKVVPFWGTEDGNLKSNVLEIVVRP